MGKTSFKILIGATGSVASLKIPTLVNTLLDLKNTDSKKYDIEIQLILTEHAKHFFGLSDIDRHVAVHDDESEWRSWRNRGDPVLHIELGKWADMLLIAPLDANTLAKTAQGLCDNLVTCVMRAWDLQKPLLFCPAMNTRMWEHPLTNEQIQKLVNWGYKQIPPIKKTLMCGDTGVGAMAEVVDIVSEVKLAIEQHVRRHE